MVSYQPPGRAPFTQSVLVHKLSPFPAFLEEPLSHHCNGDQAKCNPSLFCTLLAPRVRFSGSPHAALFIFSLTWSLHLSQVRSIPDFQSGIQTAVIMVCGTGTEEHFSSWLLWIHSLPGLCSYLGLPQPRCQHFAIGLERLHELWTCPLVKTIKIPLDRILSLQCVWPWKSASSPNLLTVHSISVSMLLEKMPVLILIPEEPHLSLASTWTLSHSSQLFQCNHPANCVSIEWSIQKIHIFPVKT